MMQTIECVRSLRLGNTKPVFEESIANIQRVFQITSTIYCRVEGDDDATVITGRILRVMMPSL